MGSETLSQQEIDLLFGTAGSSTDVHTADDGAAVDDAQLYDFRRPARISKERHRSLEAMYGQMAKSLETWLSGRIRTQLSVELTSIEQFTFAEFLLSLTTPCASYVYDVSDEHQAIIDFGSDFSFFLVERLLGGTGQLAPQNRPLTALERLLVRMVADRAAQNLAEIWQDHVVLRPELNRFEAVPGMLQVANHEDPVLVATFQVTAGPFRNLLLACVPFLVLDKFFTGAGLRRFQRAPGTPGDRELDRQSVDASLRGARVDLSVRLPGWQVPFRDIAALRPGSILATPIPAGAAADIHIAGRLRFRGQPGRLGGSVAIAIDEVAIADDDAASSPPPR